METKGMLAQCVLLAREREEIDIVGVSVLQERIAVSDD